MIKHFSRGVLACLLAGLCLYRAQSLPVGGQDKPYEVSIPLGLIEPDIPRDNPLTQVKVQLGRKLFFDRRLSLNGSVSCATCHSPEHGFAENRVVSISANGTRQRRNAPSIANAGYLISTMWDGKFRSLESQAMDPFTPWGDMGIDLGEAVDRISAVPEYLRMFKDAFGSPATTTGLAKAIASYERSLVSGGTKFDEFLYGGRKEVLTQLERDGYELFVGQASCINCHDIFHKEVNPLGGAVATFSDQRFHNLGVGYSNGRMTDTGRFEVTRNPDDWGKFKTPSLRNVSLTAPYMHDGSIATLDEVIEFYNLGCTPNPNLSPGIRPLYLIAKQKQALVAFLCALTDPNLQRAQTAIPKH